MKGLDAWLDYIAGQHAKVIELGLDRVSQVLTALGVDRSSLGCVITVAGTNGKGSTVATLEALLLAQGYRVGTYTSPHLIRYNERVRYCGRELDDEALCRAFATVEAARADTALTYFEYGTLAALQCFAERAPDFCILEVGLGGRLDAVNVVDPNVAVITTIDIDHVDWLGPDRESIGREKAGILREKAVFVCGDAKPPMSVVDRAEQLGCPSFWREKQFRVQRTEGEEWEWQGVNQSGLDLFLTSLPEVQVPVDNVATALQALAAINQLPDAEVVRTTLAGVGVDGRFQRVIWGADVVLDVGHNPQAAQYLKNRIKQHGGRWRAVFSALADKDIAQVVANLEEVIAEWHVAPLQVERAATREQLEQAFAGSNLSKIRWSESITDAFLDAVAASQLEDYVLVFGSFFTVGAILEFMQTHSPDEALLSSHPV